VTSDKKQAKSKREKAGSADGLTPARHTSRAVTSDKQQAKSESERRSTRWARASWKQPQDGGATSPRVTHFKSSDHWRVTSDKQKTKSKREKADRADDQLPA
jgi:hypothetical protein